MILRESGVQITSFFCRIKSEELTDAQMSNAKVSIVVTVSYFFFHLLYYLLMVKFRIQSLNVVSLIKIRL